MCLSEIIDFLVVNCKNPTKVLLNNKLFELLHSEFYPKDRKSSEKESSEERKIVQLSTNNGIITIEKSDIENFKIK